MVDQFVLPAAIEERTALCADVVAQRAIFDPEYVDMTQANVIQEKITALNQAKERLDKATKKAHGIKDEQEKAVFFSLNVAPEMIAMRSVCDSLELVIADKRWPIPRYREMLFQN